MLENFYARFNQPSVDLPASQALWDRRAAEVNHFTVERDDFAIQNLQRYLDLSGQSVLEISFGAGRHLNRFLQLGADVSGVEISANMCTYAKARLDASGLPWQAANLVQSSWEAIDLDQHDWRAAFDLVFLNMSPALSNTDMLKKALDASRRGLYIVLYSYRNDSLLADLQDYFGLQRRMVGSRRADDIYLLFNILYGWGYFPQLQFEERRKTPSYAPDYIIERYAGWLWRDPPASEANRLQLRTRLQQLADPGGKVHTKSYDIIGHLWLDKSLSRC